MKITLDRTDDGAGWWYRAELKGAHGWWVLIRGIAPDRITAEIYIDWAMAHSGRNPVP